MSSEVWMVSEKADSCFVGQFSLSLLMQEQQPPNIAMVHEFEIPSEYAPPPMTPFSLPEECLYDSPLAHTECERNEFSPIPPLFATMASSSAPARKRSSLFTLEGHPGKCVCCGCEPGSGSHLRGPQKPHSEWAVAWLQQWEYMLPAVPALCPKCRRRTLLKYVRFNFVNEF